MHWSDDAIVLGGRRFGESGLILDTLTATRGRRAGLVYGGAGRRKRAQFEPGNSVRVNWTGRLEHQLGHFDIAEATCERAARLLDRPLALSALASVTALLRGVLDEGDSGGASVYAPTLTLLDVLEDDAVWPAVYARWELGLLSALGFGLDLETCAVSGGNDGLTHVSPRTGRAVRGSQVPDYVERLLALPGFLTDAGAPAEPRDVVAALELSGHFLDTRVFAGLNRPIPDARRRLRDRLARTA
ncbi:MAG: DNA repair protein RecO [Alphaproteobacteria bacterium]|jgi:DNA repair protein RecO (recombination protein O)|nr:DNA repair protein RecO [Alphaproteobacteria bacterium]